MPAEQGGHDPSLSVGADIPCSCTLVSPRSINHLIPILKNVWLKDVWPDTSADTTTLTETTDATDESNIGYEGRSWLPPCYLLGGVSLGAMMASLVHPSRGGECATQGENPRHTSSRVA